MSSRGARLQCCCWLRLPPGLQFHLHSLNLGRSLLLPPLCLAAAQPLLYVTLELGKDSPIEVKCGHNDAVTAAFKRWVQAWGSQCSAMPCIAVQCRSPLALCCLASRAPLHPPTCRLPGGQWDPKARRWKFPLAQHERLVQALQGLTSVRLRLEPLYPLVTAVLRVGVAATKSLDAAGTWPLWSRMLVQMARASMPSCAACPPARLPCAGQRCLP